MKNRFSQLILILVFLSGSFQSCKSTEVIQSELILAKEEMMFENQPGNSVLTIKSNVDWRAISSESWCTLTPALGLPGTKQITVSATKNESAASRHALITVTAGNLTKQVKVIQAPNIIFSLTQKEYNVADVGGEIIVIQK